MKLGENIVLEWSQAWMFTQPKVCMCVVLMANLRSITAYGGKLEEYGSVSILRWGV